MRTSLLGLAAVALAAAAGPALAQDAAAAAPAEPAPAITITGGGTLVSDYRFRGISQTNKRFAVQGTFTIAHESGLYLSVWGSSIDDYIANGGDQEIDLIAGFKKTFSGTTFDGGVLYYYYPGSGRFEGFKYRSDFFEPYVSLAHTFGPVTAKATANYTPKQSGSGLGSQIRFTDEDGTVFRGGPKKDSLYIAGDFSAAIPTTPLSLTAHVGHTFGPSYLSIGKSYTDWNAGVAYTYKAITFGVQYVDTNKDAYSPGPGFGSASVKNISKAGVVGSVGVAF